MNKARITNVFLLCLALGVMRPLVSMEVAAKKPTSMVQMQFQTIREALERAVKGSEGEGSVEQKNYHCDAAIKTELEALKQSIAREQPLAVVIAGQPNVCSRELIKALKKTNKIHLKKSAKGGSVDLVLAPHTLYSEMESLFKASENMLHKENALPIERHPLFDYFDTLNEGGVFVVTLNSGPTISDFSNILLDKHELKLVSGSEPSLKIFKNVETFLRCLDIFARKYEEQTGKMIDAELSLSMVHIPLETYCKKLVQQFPDIAKLSSEELEKFVRLLAVFNVGNDIVDVDITIAMTVKPRRVAQRSFKPIDVVIPQEGGAGQATEISLGQQDLSKQIQNLSGSELSMPYIKDADGGAQFQALRPVIGRDKINMVDLGGGRGETNAVPKAIQDAGTTVQLLNVEPYGPFAKPYINAHRAVGIKDVQVLQKTAQDVTADDVVEHFKGEKVDALFASHAFYFLLGDMYKATQKDIQGGMQLPLDQHPVWKFFDMLADKGVMVVTLQSGAGARLYRNALLGNHGLGQPAATVADETVPLLSSFGNLATFLRHFEYFAKRYEQATGKKITVKMSYGVANVPLGDFSVERDAQTGGYILHNPQGDDNDPSWLAPKMFDFYGNWSELQKLATLTPAKAKKMSVEELKKLGLENADDETMLKKQKLAVKTQDVFLNILRVFASGMKNMQHPNIVLEIMVQPEAGSQTL